ncbi:hypothetical protein C2W62_25315 [Candidatus Entotheonella serta]|nr:hypothetical protein C2W62_25315 [Candidatus Entotheonella serta]
MDDAASTHLGIRDRWLTAGLLGIGLVTFAISASMTNLILPKLMTSMRVELYHIHWVVTAFSIARTITIPALGWMGGRMGPRALYLLSLGGFTFGMLGASLAWDWTSLLFFRIITGACGGLIPPLSMVIFYQIFSPNQRGMALGLSLMGWSIGPAIGPLTGGYLLEFASWRVAYAVIVPLSGAGLLAAWLMLPPLKRSDRRTLDVFGLVSIAIAVTTYLIALSQGRREGWDSQGILILLAVAVVAALVFIVIELRSAETVGVDYQSVRAANRRGGQSQLERLRRYYRPQISHQFSRRYQAYSVRFSGALDGSVTQLSASGERFHRERMGRCSTQKRRLAIPADPTAKQRFSRCRSDLRYAVCPDPPSSVPRKARSF